jgi:hypothetical protein
MALVLTVIAKVFELSGRRAQLWYVSRRSAIELVNAKGDVWSVLC